MDRGSRGDEAAPREAQQVQPRASRGPSSRTSRGPGLPRAEAGPSAGERRCRQGLRVRQVRGGADGELVLLGSEPRGGDPAPRRPRAASDRTQWGPSALWRSRSRALAAAPRRPDRRAMMPGRRRPRDTTSDRPVAPQVRGGADLAARCSARLAMAGTASGGRLSRVSVTLLLIRTITFTLASARRTSGPGPLSSADPDAGEFPPGEGGRHPGVDRAANRNGSELDEGVEAEPPVHPDRAEPRRRPPSSSRTAPCST